MAVSADDQRDIFNNEKVITAAEGFGDPLELSRPTADGAESFIQGGARPIGPSIATLPVGSVSFYTSTPCYRAHLAKTKSCQMIRQPTVVMLSRMVEIQIGFVNPMCTLQATGSRFSGPSGT